MEKDLREFAYFDSLPTHMQETLMQSGMKFQSEEELKSFVSQINEQGEDSGFAGFHTI